jgi:hypothetical protein
MSSTKPHGPKGGLWNSRGNSIDAEKEKQGETNDSNKDNFAHREALRENRFCKEKHISTW